MTVAIVAAMLFAGFMWSVLSGRFNNTPITGPIVMTVSGLGIWFLFADHTGASGHEHEIEELVHTLAEIALIVLLFADASRIKLTALRSNHALPLRLLLVSLPLVIVLGAGLAWWMFPAFGFAGALLLAAILAPTDAALGQAVVSNADVPSDIRRGLEFESGLNDGIALIAVLVALCLLGWTHDIGSGGGWVVFGMSQLGVGTLTGIAVGWLGASLMQWGRSHVGIDDVMAGLASLALAGLAWAVAELLTGNGLISAFVAGLTFGHRTGAERSKFETFMESEGQLLILGTFMFFGFALLPHALQSLSAAVVGYALLSLFVVRMVAVLIGTAGLGLTIPSVLFVGWFGPRGLASVVFGLFAVASIDGALNELVREVVAIVYVTVALSIVLHGLSAAPVSKRFSKINHEKI